MSSGGGGNSTTVQKADPWDKAQPYLIEGMQGAQSIYNNRANDIYYPGSTVVPMADQTIQGLNMIQNRAAAGSPLITQSQQQLQATMAGDYLDPTQNPMWNRAAREITDRVNSQFGAAGRTGSAGHAGAIAQGLGDAAAGLYGDERNRQMQGMFFAPQLAAEDYKDAQMMQTVGANYEDLYGRNLQDDINRFEYLRDLDKRNLSFYTGQVSGYGNLGGTTTATGTQAQGGKMFGNALGGAATGAAIGSAIPGIGTGIGAAAGGLLGLFG